MKSLKILSSGKSKNKNDLIHTLESNRFKKSLEKQPVIPPSPTWSGFVVNPRHVQALQQYDKPKTAME